MFRKSWRRVWPLLLLLALTAVASGISQGDYSSVNHWAHTLCTSCIGLGR
ncbi:MAG: hypothetical protein WCP21_02760 [Armatimonadota bacterium]